MDRFESQASVEQEGWPVVLVRVDVDRPAVGPVEAPDSLRHELSAYPPGSEAGPDM